MVFLYPCMCRGLDRRLSRILHLLFWMIKSILGNSFTIYWKFIENLLKIYWKFQIHIISYNFTIFSIFQFRSYSLLTFPTNFQSDIVLLRFRSETISQFIQSGPKNILDHGFMEKRGSEGISLDYRHFELYRLSHRKEFFIIHLFDIYFEFFLVSK